MFKTCCALHNWLLAYDQRLDAWSNDMSPPGEEDDGPLRDFEDDDVPDVFLRLRERGRCMGQSGLDLSRVGAGAVVENQQFHIGYHTFQKALIAHFAYRYSLGRDQAD